ncbi:MAG TPA: pyridoxal-phosphate dependent enzyme [Bacteroidales bacterium]|nr:pyridoxal-phosphate dependent enzyme [Bacteroidales bacterium]
MQDNKKALQNAIERCREKKVILPTFKQMRHPESIPGNIRKELLKIGLWDLNPLNMFRITWKNQPIASGGGFGAVNHIVLPPELTGVPARIVVLPGKYFPTGAHKVGATFGPLVEKLISGRFDPSWQKALWPSTGNYCRGGAYDSYLLGCESIAVLPEGMSKERFEWLHKVGAEIHATHGTESNVKEIYDKVKELIAKRGDEIVNLNQFEDMGNPLWHYSVTGPAMEEVFHLLPGPKKFSGVFLTQGSAGTLASADYLREKFPHLKVCAGEALQCPTLLYNGYGDHRIEGIGDKHVPWVHNIRNMDMVAGIDDNANIRLMRLFNEAAGKEYLTKEVGVDPELVQELHLLGISGIANMMGCIKLAKYYELTSDDVLFTVATDSMEMYHSRLEEEVEKHGKFTPVNAAVSFEADIRAITTDHMIEMTYYQKKRMHNLKYFTWVEQQGKTVEDLNAQWYDLTWWKKQLGRADELDALIEEFNDKTGVVKSYL